MTVLTTSVTRLSSSTQTVLIAEKITKLCVLWQLHANFSVTDYLFFKPLDCVITVKLVYP